MALTDQAPERHESPLRKLLPFTMVGILIAAIYAGYTVYSRHEATVNAEKEAVAKQQERERASDQQVLQNGQLTITAFQAEPGLVRRGETAQLCYGVVNAKSVKLDPQIEPTKPSYRHCAEISPKKTTTYTLTATGDAGQTKTASLTVRVE